MLQNKSNLYIMDVSSVVEQKIKIVFRMIEFILHWNWMKTHILCIDHRLNCKNFVLFQLIFIKLLNRWQTIIDTLGTYINLLFSKSENRSIFFIGEIYIGKPFNGSQSYSKPNKIIEWRFLLLSRSVKHRCIFAIQLSLYFTLLLSFQYVLQKL